MSKHLAILPILVPLFTAFVLFPLRNHRMWQRVLSAAAMLVVLYLAVVQAIWIRHNGMLIYQVGDWPAPFGITLAVDLFPALLIIMTAVVGTASMFYAFKTLDPKKERYFFYPLFLLLTASINGAFMTGDLFNLYVFFELILMVSYLLLSLGGRPVQLSESFKFLIINAVSGAFLLLGIALLYGLTGTLNMADLAIQVAAVADKRIIAAIAAVFLFAFGVKAALVPLFFWLPRTYAAAITPVTAFLGEVGTKVGVYALYRVFTLIFVHHIDFTHSTLLMPIAVLTMVVGVLGAIAQMDFKRLLAFHIVSQIGYMIFGLSMMTETGLAGGILHIGHHMVTSAALFLIAGATEETTGTTKLEKMTGLIHLTPALAFTFLLGALSLIGVPPMSGFFSKFLLLYAGFSSGHFLATTIAIGVSFFTLFSMIKIFRMVYWGPKQQPAAEAVQSMSRYKQLLAPGAALVAVALVLGLGADTVIDYTRTASEWLLQPSLYIESVLGAGSAEIIGASEVLLP